MRHDAIRKLYANVVTIDDGVGAFDEHGNQVLIDETLVAAEVELLRKPQYSTQRSLEYPSFAEQFDLLYHKGYDGWREVIQGVKDKYPRTTHE